MVAVVTAVCPESNPNTASPPLHRATLVGEHSVGSRAICDKHGLEGVGLQKVMDFQKCLKHRAEAAMLD